MDEWTDLDQAYLDIFGDHPDAPHQTPAAKRIDRTSRGRLKLVPEGHQPSARG